MSVKDRSFMKHSSCLKKRRRDRASCRDVLIALIDRLIA
jgi:hypothetical protein